MGRIGGPRGSIGKVGSNARTGGLSLIPVVADGSGSAGAAPARGLRYRCKCGRRCLEGAEPARLGRLRRQARPADAPRLGPASRAWPRFPVGGGRATPRPPARSTGTDGSCGWRRARRPTTATRSSANTRARCATAARTAKAASSSSPASPMTAPGATAIMIGYGVLRFENGDRYAGAVDDGTPDGFGRYASVDGTIFEGTFRAGKRNGVGMLTTPDARRFRSVWQDGEEIERAPLDDSARKGRPERRRDGQHLYRHQAQQRIHRRRRRHALLRLHRDAFGGRGVRHAGCAADPRYLEG